MPGDVTVSPEGVEEARAAFERMEAEAMALTAQQLSVVNVDVIGATSTILGVAGRVQPFRERMARLIEFDIRNVDQLEDRARAAWFVFVTHMPEPEPRDFQALFEECRALRAVMLAWAEPLVLEGHLEGTSVGKIKKGSGNRDIPNDVLSLVTLFRSQWGAVRGICGVTEAQLDRGAAIAPVVFATLARRKYRATGSRTAGSQRVRRFWTLADHSYAECQRALNFLEASRGGAAAILPSLRRNAGPGARARAAVTPPLPTSPSSSEGEEEK